MSKVSVNGIIRDATAEEQAEIDARNTEWNNSSVSRKLEKIKQIRLEKLVETDWWVLRGNMSEAQTTYRQRMRDIPQDYSETDYDDLLSREKGNLTHTVWEKP
jgi:arginine repressor